MFITNVLPTFLIGCWDLATERKNIKMSDSMVTVTVLADWSGQKLIMELPTLATVADLKKELVPIFQIPPEREFSVWLKTKGGDGKLNG